MTEKDQIEALFQRLEKQPRVAFPLTRAKPLAPKTHGVYVIRNKMFMSEEPFEGKRVYISGSTITSKQTHCSGPFI